jgi:hypothetical protein
MLIFKCDRCGSETDNYHESKNNNEVIPKGWITLSNVTIHNELPDPNLLYAGNTAKHFCSKVCFIDAFFKFIPIESEASVHAYPGYYTK